MILLDVNGNIVFPAVIESIFVVGPGVHLPSKYNRPNGYDYAIITGGWGCNGATVCVLGWFKSEQTATKQLMLIQNHFLFCPYSEHRGEAKQ